MDAHVAACKRRSPNAGCGDAGPTLPLPQGTRVLPVVLRSGGTPDDAESRLRDRYAVVAALGKTGYVPSDEEHVRYRVVSADGTGSAIPFEVYTRNALRPDPDPGRPTHVLVLWITVNLLGARPIDDLAEIVQVLAPGQRGPVHVIGPRGSRGLVALLRGVEGVPVGLPFRMLFHSPWATVDQGTLDAELGSRKKYERLARQLSRRGATITRHIADDGRLARTLVDELALRGLDLGKGRRDAVALVTEWDTFYGRAFPSTFERKLSAHAANKPPLCIEGEGECTPLYRFAYLRGLDGSLARERKAASDKSGNGGGRLVPTVEELRRWREALERPEGNGQLDYLRRVADRIEAVNRRLRAADECGLGRRLLDHCRRIGAIGVLGTDAYDKLLVLQALRPRFPDVVFFTTDLDAVMLHPAELAWTRNLVVASGFGLQVHWQQQGGVPPFRDAYQTALYAATLAALSRDAPPNGSTPGLHRDALPPRLFEVGRYGAIDLSIDDATPANGIRHPQPPDLLGLQTDAFWRLARVDGVLLLGLVIVGVLLAAPALPNRASAAETRLRGLAVVAVAAAPILVVLLLVWETMGHGEPLSLADGVSTWPTTVLDGWTTLIALGLIVRIHHALAASDSQIAADYGWQTGFAGGATGLREVLYDAARGRMHPSLRVKGGSAAPAVTAHDLWKGYIMRGTPRVRYLRALAGALLFLATAWCLLAMLGFPRVPARGAVARGSSVIVGIVCMAAVVYLNFMVVDVSRLAVRFIDELGALSQPWTDAELAERSAAWGTGILGARELARIRLIERHSDCVAPFVFYPGLAIALMLAARSTLLDAWAFPPSLLVILGLLAASVVACAIFVRRAAQRARIAALARMREQSWRLAASADPEDAALRKEAEVAIERIQALDGGAFAPLSQHPIVAAVLVPSGSLGMLALLEGTFSR
ncbi:MAG: hypothetical protein KIT14_21400 [bacterium]|nr:hypothetical protein [bacterium]